MIIETDLLPRELKNKLPITLRNQKTFDTKYIPDEFLRAKIETYFQIQRLKKLEHFDLSIQEKINTNQYKNLYDNYTEERNIDKILSRAIDIRPEKDIYGIKLITDEAEFILEQLRTFLSLGEIEVPFSPEITFNVTKYIYHADSPYIKEELYNIINDFLLILTTELSIDSDKVKLLSVDVQKVEEELYVIYIVNVTLEVNNKQYTLNLNFEVKSE